MMRRAIRPDGVSERKVSNPLTHEFASFRDMGNSVSLAGQCTMVNGAKGMALMTPETA